MRVRYYVISSDGQKYGPADVATLNQWIQEGRLLPNQMLEDEASGQRMPASSVADLNFPTQQPQAQPGQTYAPGQPYQQHYQRPTYGGDDGSADLKNAWIFAVLGFCCCLFLQIPAYIYAKKAQDKGNPGAKAVMTFIVIAVILALVLNGWWIIGGGSRQFMPTR